ncbi:hypothetical protein [Loktanella salsilacus]|uniref:hypothetical protein n=1 Tax=Loktanella salsilacus TaxID=195913 RepID=UPI0030023311
MPGVTAWGNDRINLISIDDFTVELEALIRERFSEICWGPAALRSGSAAHNYKNTMRSMWRRISTKSEATKIGMIGELLTHLFLVGEDRKFQSVNMLFNLEEASIKKGFDLVVRASANDEIYLVEVKSSAIARINAESKAIAMLNKGDADIFGKLNNPADNLWSNALHHCSSALRKTDLRDKIEEILSHFQDEAFTAPSAAAHNVILAGVGFNAGKAFCEAVKLQTKIDGKANWNQYKSLEFFIAQKETFQATIDFIEKEAA